MNLKPKNNISLIIGAIVLGLTSFAILASNKNRPKDVSAYSAPSVGLLELTDNKLIVHAKSNEPDSSETFVYCLSRENSSDGCEWDNADEFELSEEGDYYVFIKSIASGKISESKLMSYEPIDPSKVKM